MPRLCHLRFIVNVIDVSKVVVAVRVFEMCLTGFNTLFFPSHIMEVHQQIWQKKTGKKSTFNLPKSKMHSLNSTSLFFIYTVKHNPSLQYSPNALDHLRGAMQTPPQCADAISNNLQKVALSQKKEGQLKSVASLICSSSRLDKRNCSEMN